MKKTVTKFDIQEVVFEKVGYTKKFSRELVEEALNSIKESLRSGRGVKIHGFGRFGLNDKRSRRGKSPQTGEFITIPARRSLSFHPSIVLRKYFNN